MNTRTQTPSAGTSQPPYRRRTPLAEVMVRGVITIQLRDQSSVADALMKLHPIHHLPVLEGEVLRGVISQRDLFRAMLSTIYYEDEDEQHSFLERYTDIASIMTPEPLTLAPTDTLGQALELMREHQVGCVPIVDGRNHLLGLITESDLLRILDDVLPS